MRDAATWAESTPDTRDRYIDFLRVFSLGVVILGHWFMVVVRVNDNGTVTATNSLALLPYLQPMTWLFQVMPVFFFVGGFSHFVSLTSLRRKGGTYVDFVYNRAIRLVTPTAVFVGVWLGLAVIIEITGHDQGILRLASRTIAQPLWFIGVYLGIIAMAPVMIDLHQRWGRRRHLGGAIVPIALVVAVASVDVMRFIYEIPHVGYLNVALVWLAVHQMGFLYADGSLQRGGHRVAGVLVLGGLGCLCLLTLTDLYPLSMVGMPGERVSNMLPPTFALLTHAMWLLGLVLLPRDVISGWLRRTRVWTIVIMANGLAMTAFLWHLTALFAVTALTITLGLPQSAVGSAEWWLLRPVWITIFAVAAIGLILVFRHVEYSRALRQRVPPFRRTSPWQTIASVIGMVLCVVGILGLSRVGFGGLLAGRTAKIIIMPVTPLLSTSILAVGGLLISTLPRLQNYP